MNETLPKDEQPDRIEQLHASIGEEDIASIREVLSDMLAPEIADVLESLPPKSREMVWNLVGTDLEGDVLSELQDAVRTELLEQMHPHEVAAITRDLDTDDVADIIQDLPEELQNSVLFSMDEQNRKALASVLSFPENSAGGLMNIDVVSVRADVKLDVILRYLRRLGEIPEKTDILMVTDRDNNYLGELSLIDMLIEDPEQTVAEVMSEDTGIAAMTPANEVAKLFEQRDLVSAAVVDEENKLLGRITVDDVVDVIQEEAEQSFRNMAGLSYDDMFAPVITTAKRRAIWLGINLATAFLAAWVIGRFEETIEQLVALAVLMPIVAGMGGISGSQTLTVSIRGIALGQLSKANARALLYKELAVGALNGLVWATVVALIVIFWFGSNALGIIIALAMIINLVVAALAGAVIPLALKRFGIDPAIAGSVLLTTVTDVIGFMTFLGLATLYLLH